MPSTKMLSLCSRMATKKEAINIYTVTALAKSDSSKA